MFGEVLPHNSGLTLGIKSHGHTTGKGSLGHNVTRHDQYHKYNHFNELNRTAILLIRNPFQAIITHRHLDEAGSHTGFASKKHFMGKGTI